MVERIDYEIGPDWDIHFTEWDDFATAVDDRVLAQNFTLVAAGKASGLLGEPTDATRLSRVRRRIATTYRRRDDVDSVSVSNFEVDGGVLRYDVAINSNEFSEEVRIGAN